MELPLSQRRDDISVFFDKKDYDSLVALGFSKHDSTGNFDCASYVLNCFGIPGRPEFLDVLSNLKKSDIPLGIPKQVIFYYNLDSGKINFRHYGVYEKGKVFSKWGLGPVFIHDIEDVPYAYGHYACFGDLESAKIHIFQRMQGLNL